MKKIEEFKRLSKKYNIGVEDIVLIALNVYGVNIEDSSPRIRLKLVLDTKKGEEFYFGLPNRVESCFEIKNNILYLEGNRVAIITNIENDDCASSYYRKNKTVIMLNSNSRSKCNGCKFCPNNLELNSEDDSLVSNIKLRKHFINMLNKAGHKDMSNIERVTICTGCFGDEKRLVNHIQIVNDVLVEMNFKGYLHYIGSEITSKESLDVISRNINKFMITLTVECFTRRDLILKSNKAKITIEKYIELIKQCTSLGFITNIIYILGLDPLDDVIKNMQLFSKYTNYFPSINIFQVHNGQDKSLCCDEYDKLEYILKARKKIEEIYINTNLRPSSWECYRPLWYFEFADEKLCGIRI